MLFVLCNTQYSVLEEILKSFGKLGGCKLNSKVVLFVPFWSLSLPFEALKMDLGLSKFRHFPLSEGRWVEAYHF